MFSRRYGVNKKVNKMRKSRLQDDCWYSGIQVYSANWNTTRAPMREKWYIWYRFYDPAFSSEKNKGVKKIIIKAGINDYLDREDRQAAVRFLVENEKMNWVARIEFLPQEVCASILFRIENDTFRIIRCPVTCRHLKRRINHYKKNPEEFLPDFL